MNASDSALADGPKRPVAETDRIQSLDVLRGFALLGILLLNILGFGLLMESYSNPDLDLREGTGLDFGTWLGVELFAEGAMRCLFSILFGAGVVLFATGARAKSGWLYTKRTFFLFAFGLFDAFILLWNGDILTTYAMAGALLYWVRNWRARWLLLLAAILLVLTSGFYGFVQFGLGQAKAAADQVAAATVEEEVSADVRAAAAGWDGFYSGYQPTAEQIEQQLEARRGSYASAFVWNRGKTIEMIAFIIPVFMLWDGLLMMMIGMALFKLRVLQGRRSRAFYIRLSLVGFSIGLAANGFEVYRAYTSNFDVFHTFAQMQPTYHVGRLGVGLGWLGLVVLLTQTMRLRALQSRLAAVGRMALSNYLMHSVVALFLFTGAGLGLVARLGRFELLLVVFGIWLLQLWLSPWWLRRHLFGPAEWLWRWLTYGRRPPLLRDH